MRWRRVFGRNRIDRERAEELQAHLDLATEYYVARGLPPAEAARRARLRRAAHGGQGGEGQGEADHSAGSVRVIFSFPFLTVNPS